MEEKFSLKLIPEFGGSRFCLVEWVAMACVFVQGLPDQVKRFLYALTQMDKLSINQLLAWGVNNYERQSNGGESGSCSDTDNSGWNKEASYQGSM